MMTKNNKSPLGLDLYEQYGIDQSYSAYIIIFDNIDDTECDNLEYEYVAKGYKIFSSELSRETQGKVSLKLIVAKLEIIF